MGFAHLVYKLAGRVILCADIWFVSGKPLRFDWIIYYANQIQVKFLKHRFGGFLIGATHLLWFLVKLLVADDGNVLWG